jgi:hypothetical protein
LEAIARVIETHPLTVTCGSNRNQEAGLVTGTCTSHSEKEMYEYTSPAISATSSRQAELLSIMVTLYIVQQAEQCCDHPSDCTVIITSNNKKEHKEAFNESPPGVTTATQADYDLIMEIH